MTQVPTLNFILKKNKPLKEGSVPIYLRVTINGTRTELSTKINVNPKDWDERSGRIKGRGPIVIRNNKSLNDLTVQVYDGIEEIIKHKLTVDSKNLKLALKGELEQKTLLISTYELYLEHLKKRIGIDFTDSSFEINNVTFNHFKEFLQREMKLDLGVDEFSNALFNRFEQFLKLQKGNSHNTVYKKIERLKSMFKWAYTLEHAQKDLTRKFRIKKQKKEIVFLTQEELDRLAALQTIERLEIIRDCFLFMCYTSLAFKEIQSLTTDNLSRKISGGYGLIQKRQKTGKNIPEIPLLPQALSLIEKYANHPKRKREKKLLPIPSNQKFNAYLKELATLANIERPITTHVGRKTFATTIALRNGMSMEVVSKIMGHQNMRITQEYYADIQNERIGLEFKKLSATLNENRRSII